MRLRNVIPLLIGCVVIVHAIEQEQGQDVTYAKRDLTQSPPSFFTSIVERQAKDDDDTSSNDSSKGSDNTTGDPNDTKNKSGNNSDKGGASNTGDTAGGTSKNDDKEKITSSSAAHTNKDDDDSKGSSDTAADKSKNDDDDKASEKSQSDDNDKGSNDSTADTSQSDDNDKGSSDSSSTSDDTQTQHQKSHKEMSSDNSGKAVPPPVPASSIGEPVTPSQLTATQNGPVNVEDVLDSLPECYKTCGTTVAGSYSIGCSKLTELGCICTNPRFFNSTVKCITFSGTKNCVALAQDPTALQHAQDTFIGLCHSAGAGIVDASPVSTTISGSSAITRCNTFILLFLILSLSITLILL